MTGESNAAAHDEICIPADTGEIIIDMRWGGT